MNASDDDTPSVPLPPGITPKRFAELISAAHHWEEYADSAERMAAWDRRIGIDLSEPGQSAGDHKARQARAVANAHRKEAETGIAHCVCHLKPIAGCAIIRGGP